MKTAYCYRLILFFLTKHLNERHQVFCCRLTVHPIEHLDCIFTNISKLYTDSFFHLVYMLDWQINASECIIHLGGDRPHACKAAARDTKMLCLPTFCDFTSSLGCNSQPPFLPALLEHKDLGFDQINNDSNPTSTWRYKIKLDRFRLPFSLPLWNRMEHLKQGHDISGAQLHKYQLWSFWVHKYVHFHNNDSAFKPKHLTDTSQVKFLTN
jgi:hypothetical protein